MGGLLSPSQPNPNDPPNMDASYATASEKIHPPSTLSEPTDPPAIPASSSVSQTQNRENQTSTETANPSIDTKFPEDRKPGVSERSKSEAEAEEGFEDGEKEEEEEGECGFCLFMKGGGCKESFIAWEKCVEDAEKNKEDIVEKCSEITGLLKKCMEEHADYYEPILRAEEASREEAIRELEREKASRESEQPDASIGDPVLQGSADKKDD